MSENARPIGAATSSSSAATEPETKSEKPESSRLIFGSLLSRLFGTTRDSTPPATPSNTLERLQREMTQIVEEADARLQKGDPSIEPGSARSPAKSSRGEDPRTMLRRRREEDREAMEANIARLHEQLGTGLEESLMRRLRLLLTAHGPSAVEPHCSSIEERIEKSVLEYFFARASEAAWRRLEDRMAATGLSWPVRDGLPETLSPEELQRLRVAHGEEIRLAFLEARPQQQAALIQGEVKIWVYGYPARDGYLWLQTALRGVAAALCAQYFAAALELWMWRPPELERQLLATLDTELEVPRRLSREGVRSLAEAMEVTERVDEICRRTVPALVWDYLAPRLRWPDAGAALSVSVLAEGLSEIDPVCGMSLCGSKVMDRLEHAGRVHFFCGDRCRHQFEADPARFVSKA